MACPAGDAAGWRCSQDSAPSSRVGPDVHQALGDCALGLALSIARRGFWRERLRAAEEGGSREAPALQGECPAPWLMGALALLRAVRYGTAKSQGARGPPISAWSRKPDPSRT